MSNQLVHKLYMHCVKHGQFAFVFPINTHSHTHTHTLTHTAKAKAKQNLQQPPHSYCWMSGTTQTLEPCVENPTGAGLSNPQEGCPGIMDRGHRTHNFTTI